MAKIKEYKHEWTDWKGTQCACHIRLFDGTAEAAGKKVVIATDINIGNSVTNQVEEIGTDICRIENINPLDLMLIEHYEEAHRPKFDETFDLVDLTWNERERKFQGVDWKHSSKEAIELIIGEKLP